MAANPGQMRFDYVAPSTIRHDAPQVRRDWRHDNDQEKLKGLERSIARHGILHPLLVRLLAPGQINGYRHELIAGHGRLVCSLRLNLPEVPVLVMDADDRAKALLQLSENMHRRHLLALDEALAMQALIKAEGWTQARMAEELGVSASLVSQRLGLLRDEVLRDAQQRGLIAAHTVTLLSQSGDDDYTRPLYERLARGEKITERDVLAARAAREAQSAYVSPRTLGGRDAHTEEQLRHVADLRRQGLSNHEIAGRMGISRKQVIRDVAQLEGDTSRKAGQPPLSGLLSRDDLRGEVHRLHQEGLSVVRIAGRIGISERTARDLLLEAQHAHTDAAVAPRTPEEGSADAPAATHTGADAPPVPPSVQGAALIDRLPQQQAEALREAVGPAINEQTQAAVEQSDQAPAPAHPTAQPEPQYSRNPEHVVVERPAAKSAAYHEPTLEELFAPVRQGPCWLPMGRILHKAAKDGLSAAALYEAYRAAGGSR